MEGYGNEKLQFAETNKFNGHAAQFKRLAFAG